MKRLPKSFIRDYLLTVLAFILFGVVFLVFPDTSGKIICYIFGGFLGLVGLIRSVEYFLTPVSLNEYRLGLVVGLIALGGGVYVLAKPEPVQAVLPTVLALAILLDSLVKLQNAFDMIKLHDRLWRITLPMAVTGAALGCVMLLNPFDTAKALVLFLGIALAFNGAMDALSLLLLYRRVKRLEKEKKPETAQI